GSRGRGAEGARARGVPAGRGLPQGRWRPRRQRRVRGGVRNAGRNAAGLPGPTAHAVADPPDAVADPPGGVGPPRRAVGGPSVAAWRHRRGETSVLTAASGMPSRWGPDRPLAREAGGYRPAQKAPRHGG